MANILLIYIFNETIVSSVLVFLLHVRVVVGVTDLLADRIYVAFNLLQFVVSFILNMFFLN